MIRKACQIKLMELPANIFAIYSILAGLVWVFGFAIIARQLYSVPKISEINPSEPESYPTLSILVPACNEEESIEPALRSLLGQDYPGLEILAIDDRSMWHLQGDWKGLYLPSCFHSSAYGS